jgi:SAM-dependent methyltransferase
MPAEVGAGETEHRGRDETGETDEDRCEKRLSQHSIISPSPFVAEWIGKLAGRHQARALDVAMGRGRHALPLAEAGFVTFGVDKQFDIVRDAVHAARDASTPIVAWCADLTMYPLPVARFDLIVVTRYLQRDLFPAIRGAVRPDGIVLYETFTIHQRALGWGPASPDHLLREGELRGYFDDFEIVFYEETSAPEAVARLVARRRS